MPIEIPFFAQKQGRRFEDELSTKLNPVERLWKFIKDNVLKNLIYETLEDLKISTCNFIKNLSTQTIKSSGIFVEGVSPALLSANDNHRLQMIA